ncbi:MAG: diacylglycerol kinase [Synergistaceae bacterium]|nr:diacylglycerol kinase [Synergistaceae bacterium]
MKYSNPFLRLFNASRYSLSGLYYALINEQAFQYEFVVFVVLCGILFFVPLIIERKIFLIFAWLVVMCLELINSSVEKAFDLIDKNFRHEIKAGKDMLSAAVFLSVSFNIFLWLILIFNF